MILITHIALFAFVLITTGCNQQITDFVSRSRPTITPPDPTDPATSNSNPIGQKISPAANVVSGSQVTSQFTITPTNREVKGAQVKSKFSFYQTRPQ